MAIFEDNPGKMVPECQQSGFHISKVDGGGSVKWSYKTCKVPVKSSPSTNQLPPFYWTDTVPVTQSEVPGHRREKPSHSTDFITQP